MTWNNAMDIVARLTRVIGNRTILDRTMTRHAEGSIGLNMDCKNGNILSLIVDNIF